MDSTVYCQECAQQTVPFVDPTGERSCSECGFVIADSDWCAEADFPSNGPPAPRGAMPKPNRYSRPPRENYKQLRQAAEALQINREDESKAKRFFKEINDWKYTWPTGLVGQLRALACLYFAVKGKHPISLNRMARDCQVPLDRLRKTVRECETILKGQVPAEEEGEEEGEEAVAPQNLLQEEEAKPSRPDLFVERCCGELKPPLSPEQRLEVVNRCKLLTQFAEDQSLLEGRNPLGLAAAVLFLSLESCGQTVYLTAAGKTAICQQLGISAYTATERSRELLKRMIDKANRLFPWTTTETNWTSHFQDLQAVIEEERKEAQQAQSDTSSTNTEESRYSLPPAYISSHQAKERRRAKMIKAIERIKCTLSSPDIQDDTPPPQLRSYNSSDVRWDEEDLLIEELLLKGVSEEDIINGYYKSGLATAKQVIPSHDINSEQLGDDDISEAELLTYIRGYKRSAPAAPSGAETTLSPPAKRFRLE